MYKVSPRGSCQEKKKLGHCPNPPFSSFLSYNFSLGEQKSGFLKMNTIIFPPKEFWGIQENILINSASADGGPRSRVCAPLTLRSAPPGTSRHFSFFSQKKKKMGGVKFSKKFSTNFLVKSGNSKHFFPPKKKSGGGGVVKKFKNIFLINFLPQSGNF